MSRRTTKVRLVTSTSSSKSAARSKSRKRGKRGPQAKDTGSSDTGTNNDIDSPSSKPSPTAVQATLPSATPLHIEDDASLQPCATQHGTTELEELLPSIRVRTDFTQDSISEGTLVAVTAHAALENSERLPSPKKNEDEPVSAKVKKKKRNTLSTRAFLPPHLIGRNMSHRRTKRVKNSTNSERHHHPPSSDESTKQTNRVTSGKQSDGTNSKRSTSKKRKKRDKKGKRSDHSNYRDEQFYRRVEKNKDKKVEVGCSCPVTRCEGCERVCKRIGGCFKTSAHACWVACLPPLPNLILNKAAFWPPPREYYFYRESTVDGSTKKIKMKKANKSSLNQPWTFGFEHPCYKLYAAKHIECFTVETRKHHYIGCLMARTPTRHPRYTLLYSHPNGSDISDHINGIPSITEIAKFLDCDIVIYDYSGYGISSGQSNEKSIFADIEGVFQYLLNVRKIDPAKIVLYGYSIGTAASIALLAETQTPVAGLILLAPPTSMLRVLLWKRVFFQQPFKRQKPCIDKFRSMEKITLVSVPTLICHGKNDGIVPIEHGQAMYEKTPNKVPPLWIADAGHNNLENTKELWVRVRHFLNNELSHAKTPGTSTKNSPILETPLATDHSSQPRDKPTVIHL